MMERFNSRGAGMSGDGDSNQGPMQWKFFRAGGFDQVRLDSGRALMSLGSLDQKLWAALSCPTRGIELDQRTLDIIDSDKDGRIRAGEVIAMVEWAGNLLKHPDLLLKREDALPLDAIDDAKPEGRAVLAAAKRILAKSGKAGADTITLAEVAGVQEVFAANDFNGDGIVPAEIVEDPSLRSVIEDIIACLGGETDRGGLPGVSEAKVKAFFQAAEAHAAWAAKAEADPDLNPVAGESAKAAEAVSAVSAKLDDWFTRCALAAFDSRAAGPLNRSEEDWAGLAGHLLSDQSDELAAFPLALVGGGSDLPLGAGLNPAWAAAMARFRAEVVVPLLGERDTLSAEDWHGIKRRFAARAAWAAEMPEGPVARLGTERIKAILSQDAQAAIESLIAQDLALEAEAKAIDSVDKLLRCCRDLAILLNNFVAFRDFYTRKHRAVFQAGTLFLDGRSCDLCVRVEDPAKHAMIATLSRIYMVYCECRRRGAAEDGEKMYIAAAVTDGDSDQLMVGRNGVFYDRKGVDWDATIVHIIDHPISIRQSFWAPYKKVGKMIGQMVEKAAAARAKAADEQVAAAAVSPKIPLPGAKPAPAPAPAPAAAAAAPAVPAAPFDAGRFAGIFAALGLAIGAIGTALASVVTGFLALPWWQIPLALVGALLAVSGPSMIIASFKLHQRHLGPILDANGWAVNTHARINIPFGTALTHLAKLPEGAQRSLKDPYAQKEPPWRSAVFAGVVLAALALAWKLGWIAKLVALVHK